MIFDVIRLVTFRNQLIELQKRGARIGLDLINEKLQSVTVKSVGLFTVTVAYDDLDLEGTTSFSIIDDGRSTVAELDCDNEECILYEDTILITDIYLISEKILERINVEEAAIKLKRLL